VIERLEELTSATNKELNLKKINQIYPTHAAALRRAKLAQKGFPLLSNKTWNKLNTLLVKYHLAR
jgi:hypothetical protein